MIHASRLVPAILEDFRDTILSCLPTDASELQGGRKSFNRPLEIAACQTKGGAL